jgi:hypothetical protein
VARKMEMTDCKDYRMKVMQGFYLNLRRRVRKISKRRQNSQAPKKLLLLVRSNPASSNN